MKMMPSESKLEEKQRTTKKLPGTWRSVGALSNDSSRMVEGFRETKRGRGALRARNESLLEEVSKR